MDSTEAVTVASWRRRRSLAFGAIITLGVAAILIAGPVVQVGFTSDVGVYITACYESAKGLVMGRDFFSPIGPAAVAPATLGTRWGLDAGWSLATGNALIFGLYGIAAWFAARRWKGAFYTGLFVLFVAATAAAPFPLDFFGWRQPSYGLLYNRLGWAASCLCAAVVVPEEIAPIEVGVLQGWVAVWLLLLKPNYLLLEAPFLIYVAVRLSRSEWSKWILSFAASGLATAGAVGLAVPFSPLGYFHTLLGMSGSAPKDLIYLTLSNSLKSSSGPAIVVIVLWTGLSFALKSEDRHRRLLAASIILAVVAVFICNLVNCQFGDFPFFGALGLCAAASAVEIGASWKRRAFRGVGLLLVAFYLWQPLASFCYAAAWRLLPDWRHGRVVHVDAPPFSSLPFADYAPTDIERGSGSWIGLSPGYVERCNDGLRLIRSVHAETATIACLDWDNPFPGMLRSGLVYGDQIAWHVGRTVNTTNAPDPLAILSQADVVLVPNVSLQPESATFKARLFEPGLKRGFEAVATSPYWTLWRRRADVEPHPAAKK